MGNETPVQDSWTTIKSWYKSRTIWGAIFMAIAYALRIFAPQVDAQGIADEVTGAAETLAPMLDNIWSLVLEVVGLVLAVFGRVKAKAGIKTPIKK